MKITLLQQDISWKNPKENLSRAEQAMAQAPGSDLYVLPEMFSTGFCTNPDEVAEPEEGETLIWMRTYADRHQCAVAGSVVVRVEERYYNRFYFVYPDGTYQTYDKKHLFTYGGEHLRFTAGEERVVVNYKGVRILLQICYDLRFPIWARNRNDYDVILYVASWPTPRIAAWDTLLHARAIENQCFVAGVNRVGQDPACEYCGGTAWIDPYGKTVAECTPGQADAITVEVDLHALGAFRRQFPVLDDADNFMIINSKNK